MTSRALFRPASSSAPLPSWAVMMPISTIMEPSSSRSRLRGWSRAERMIAPSRRLPGRAPGTDRAWDRRPTDYWSGTLAGASARPTPLLADAGVVLGPVLGAHGLAALAPDLGVELQPAGAFDRLAADL